MKYLLLKDLISDIQKGVLDTKTILIDVDWKEGTLKVFDNKEETIWDGSTSYALLEIIHHCLGVLTIHDMQMVLYEERLKMTSERPNQIWQSLMDIPKEEWFARLSKAAEKQSQQIPDKL
jgi:hypothetical protein